MIWISLAVLLISTKPSAAQIDWCAKEYDCVIDGVTHKNTMCDDGKPAPGNGKDVATDASKKTLLRAHNAHRNNTAAGGGNWPKGADMRQFTWDYTLEDLATHWGVQCKIENDVCRKTPKYPEVSQNIGAVSFKEGDPDPSLEMVSDWIKTQRDVGSGSITETINSFVKGDWNDATNIIWAEAVKVGCGEVLCIKDKGPTSLKNYRVLVCNYAPGGNIPNKPIYKIGDPCSTGCPAGTACKTETLYTQLCALPGDPIDDSLGADPRPTPGPGPDPSTSPAPGPGPAPGPTTPSTSPGPTPGPTPDPSISTTRLPPTPFINLSVVIRSWSLNLLLVFVELSMLR